MLKLKLSPFATAALLLVVGANLSLAAVGMGRVVSTVTVASENIRPLTIKKSLSAEPAYGIDDEDCVMQTRREILDNGKENIVRKLVCADIDID